MTVETRLRTAMADAVAPTIPDTERLVSTARRQGLGIRRRRQALGSVGVAAAIGLVALAPSFVAGVDHRDRFAATASTPVGSSPISFEGGRTEPIAARSVAAALLYAVGLETTGKATGFRGVLHDGEIVQASGEFAFTPTGSSTAGLVDIDVQRVPANVRASGPAVSPGPCNTDFETECEVKQLADSSMLRTSLQSSPHRGRLRLVSLSRTDGVYVTASASNGTDSDDLDGRVTRTTPVLSTAQLVAIVRQEWWSVRLPAYFTTQGEQLDPFTVPQRWVDK